MKKIRRKTKKHQKRIEKAGVKEKTKIKNFLKKVIDKYREWCYCMVVQNNKRKTKQRRWDRRKNRNPLIYAEKGGMRGFSSAVLGRTKQILRPSVWF